MMQRQSGPAARDQPVSWLKQTKPQSVKFVYHAPDGVLSDVNIDTTESAGMMSLQPQCCNNAATVLQSTASYPCHLQGSHDD